MFADVDTSSALTGGAILQTLGVLGGIITVCGAGYAIIAKLINIGVEKNKYDNLCNDVTELKKSFKELSNTLAGDQKLQREDITELKDRVTGKFKVLQQQIILIQKFQAERGLNESVFKGHIEHK